MCVANKWTLEYMFNFEKILPTEQKNKQIKSEKKEATWLLD